MNDFIRKQVDKVIDKLEVIKADLRNICDNEQEDLGNIPERFQGTWYYEICEEAVSNLEEAYDALDSALKYLETAQSKGEEQ